MVYRQTIFLIVFPSVSHLEQVFDPPKTKLALKSLDVRSRLAIDLLESTDPLSGTSFPSPYVRLRQSMFIIMFLCCPYIYYLLCMFLVYQISIICIFKNGKLLSKCAVIQVPHTNIKLVLMSPN